MKKPGRTALTITALALAIALSITLLSFGEGVRSGYGQLLEERGTDIFVGGPGSNIFFNSMSFFANGKNISEEIGAMPEVRAAVPILSGYFPFYALNQENWTAKNSSIIQRGRITLFGTIAGGAQDFVGEEKDLLNGHGLATPGDPHYENGTYQGPFTGEIVLTQRMAERLSVQVGDNIYINAFLPSPSEANSWMENATSLMVTHITPDGNRRGIMHLSEVQTLSGLRGGEVGEIRVDLYDPSKAQETARKIEDMGVSAFTVDDVVGESERFISSFKELANVLSAVALAVAGMFTSTIMLIATHERKKELGLLRALGFRQKTILKYVLSQALFLAMAGCMLGLLLGLVGVGVVEDIVKNQFITDLPEYFSFSQVTPMIMLVSLLISLLVAVVAGLLSFHQAMRIKVVEVLHGD
ncbi:MAG: FtsX-like permease family protein [Candidatus Thermoplasmatota archaeon]|nr:FtsX-like permease family protein [Candidatus Thermoplasmatota archaeon]